MYHLSELALAKMIRSDKVDVLVELTGHTANNRLGVMAMKAAPIQATWIGYPNSTGLAEVDYRITDWTTDPGESQTSKLLDASAGEHGRNEAEQKRWTRQTYVETLERLPGCFLCYTPAHDAPPVAPLPATQIGSVTFGTFNALAKVTEEVVATWAEVLKRVPSSRLLIKAKPFLCPDGRKHVEGLFTKNGVDPNKRVDLVPLVASNSGHLSVYGHVDIALDPWPYAGTTTTCEALYMGVPTITLKGRCHAQNVGWTLTEAVGLKSSDFCAESKQAYVDMAVRWATSLPELSEIRKNLRQMMLKSKLCQAEPFVRNLEGVYSKWWKKYCREISNSCKEIHHRQDEDDSDGSEASGESAQAMAGTNETPV